MAASSELKIFRLAVRLGGVASDANRGVPTEGNQEVWRKIFVLEVQLAVTRTRIWQRQQKATKGSKKGDPQASDGSAVSLMSRLWRVRVAEARERSAQNPGGFWANECVANPDGWGV